MSSNVQEMRDQVRQLKIEIEEAKVSVVELNNLFTTYLALARRFGISGDIMELLTKAQQARIAIQTLTRSIQIFYATSGPIGWLLAIGGVALSTLMVADMMEIRRPRY